MCSRVAYVSQVMQLVVINYAKLKRVAQISAING